MDRFDVAVVGAGILGLATAHHAAADGQRVVVLERDARAEGASVRNFGMVWPVGQPSGPRLERALRSRQHWLGVVTASGLHHRAAGSLHLAYHPDELALIEEFVARETSWGRECAVLTPAETLRRSSSVVGDGLLGALWSPTEVNVDPMEVVADLPVWLAGRGVDLRFGCTVVEVEPGRLRTSAGEVVEAERIVVCAGAVRDLLFPDLLGSAPLRLCKLQMLRTAPQPGAGWDLGPMLAAGATLAHYPAFHGLAALDAVRRRFAETTLSRFGIHVMASQTASGAVTLGDSHEYDADVGPFDRTEIDDAVLGYATTFLSVPDARIAERWHGTYVTTTDGSPAVVCAPDPAIRVLTGVGGAGMTISFAVAEEVWRSFGDASPPLHLDLA